MMNGERTEIKFYCDSCGEHRPVEIEPLRKDRLNGDVAWGDVVCKECRFVITTLTSEMEGTVRLDLIPSRDIGAILDG